MKSLPVIVLYFTVALQLFLVYLAPDFNQKLIILMEAIIISLLTIAMAILLRD